MLSDSPDPDSRSRRPGPHRSNRDGFPPNSPPNSAKKVLVCSHTLGERRKLLGYFSQLGAPVLLCSEPKRAADELGSDIALLVVNVFDCDWSVGKWIDVVSQHSDDGPIIFVHQTAAAKDRLSDKHETDDSAGVLCVHVTEESLLPLCDPGLSGIRARIAARQAHT